MTTENVQLSTWLPPDEAAAVRDIAKAHRRSVSQMIREAVVALIAKEAATDR